MNEGGQQDLFGSAAPDAVEATAHPALGPLAARLPGALRMGTSSWSFPGWQGLVWARRHRETDLARHGLAAYARHPLLRAVGVDRAFYAPLRTAEWREFAAATPADFRYLVKAHAALTIPPGARRPEFLARAPLAFLDADYALRHVVEPAVEGLGDRLGVLLLQFSPLPAALLREPRRVIERLHAFLEQMPRGVQFAIEWRDAAMLGADYESMLEATGAVHGYSAHPRMPRLAQQLSRPGRGPCVVRWLLERGQLYEEARSRYAPFDRLVDPDPETRGEIASVVWQALQNGDEGLVIINNKAEGSAPLSVELLAREFAARLVQ
ncbi:MAG: DUF72 domain-containing protein [Steroidobacteraceae bacterium]